MSKKISGLALPAEFKLPEWFETVWCMRRKEESLEELFERFKKAAINYEQALANYKLELENQKRALTNPKSGGKEK